MAGVADHGDDDKSAGKTFAGVEKLLYAGGPKLSSQVLEGSLHLYKRRLLSDLEQFGEASDASLYHQMEELPALRK